MEKGNAAQFKNKSLEEIDINMEDVEIESDQIDINMKDVEMESDVSGGYLLSFMQEIALFSNYF